MRFDGQPVVGVLVEEWMAADREIYLAFAVDRSSRLPVLLASPAGGVAVEETSPVTRLPVDPWVGMRGHHLRNLSSVLEIPRNILSPVLEAIWRAFRVEDALLVEVNPVGVCPDGLVALDARVFVDESARYRHEAWPPSRGGTEFEAQCAALGVTGVEMDGDIAVVTSGAGLAMASLDLLVSMGGRVRAVVDLGALVFQQPEKIQQLMRLLAELRPKVLLFNFFLQLARCDALAAGMIPALQDSTWSHVVVRMRGVGSPEARAILEPSGVAVYEDLREAFRAAVGATAVHPGV
jgi:succinyl-CoA synthetase beta subunit